MALPPFSTAEAINQLISGAVTLGSVLLAARIAFGQGLRHLRHERALDRRLQSQEAVLGVMGEYRTMVRVLLSAYEEPSDGKSSAYRDRALQETTALGRQLATALSKVELYGSDAEQMHARHLHVTQMGIYVHTWGLTEDSTDHAEHLEALKRSIASLDEAQKLQVTSLRRELDLVEGADSKGSALMRPKRDAV